MGLASISAQLVGGLLVSLARQDTGSAAGVFLTAAQSPIAFGNIFFACLDQIPRQTDYLAAPGLTLSCCLMLPIAAFVLMSTFPGRQQRRGLR